MRSTKIDKEFEKLGFTKMREDDYCVSYELYVEEYKFTQCVDILNKRSGNHIIQPYDKNLSDTKNIGNTRVGLNSREAILAVKKIKAMRW